MLICQNQTFGAIRAVPLPQQSFPLYTVRYLVLSLGKFWDKGKFFWWLRRKIFDYFFLD